MQLTLDFDAGLVSAYSTCREFVAHRVHASRKKQKAIAADMDCSPSDLSRKLTQAPGDTRRFGLDDLEKFIQVTGDLQPIYYLVEKYCIGSLDDISMLEERLAYLRQEQAVKSPGVTHIDPGAA